MGEGGGKEGGREEGRGGRRREKGGGERREEERGERRKIDVPNLPHSKKQDALLTHLGGVSFLASFTR